MDIIVDNKFDGLYHIRPATDDDKNFILKSFLLSVYHGETWFTKIPKRIFMDNYKKVAETLFYAYKDTIRVACLPDDSTVILGYAIINQDGTTLHFIYVKDVWRKRGIGRRLVPESITHISHLTALGEQLLNKFKTKPIFNPFNI